VQTAENSGESVQTAGNSCGSVQTTGNFNIVCGV
jgi:hypothetical protein